MMYHPIKLKTNHNKINKYTILGERHSGTNLLEECMFYHSDITVTWEYGWKHFFGFCDRNILKNANDTLFICIVRNPYDWLLAMQSMPYHATHFDRRKNTFFFQEWYSTNNNKEILEDRNFITKDKYKNIFDLRTNKLQYIFNIIPEIVSNLLIIDYNNLVLFSEIFFNTLETHFNIKYSTNKFRNVHFSKPKQYFVDEELLNIINTNLDWSIESNFGYFPKKNNNAS